MFFLFHEEEAQALYLILKYNRVEVSDSRQISDMLNNMVASFTASNQIGEAMKKQGLNTKKSEKKD